MDITGTTHLILSRSPGQSIVIDGRIVVTIEEVRNYTVRLGIRAPIDVTVHRAEIQERIEKEGEST